MESTRKNEHLTTRRNFLRSLPVFSAGVFLPFTSKNAAAVPVERKKLAIQLWSLRDIIKTDLRGALAEVSRMGFTGIEPYGFDGKFYGIEALDFRNMCADLNLDIYSTHTGITAENANSYAEKAIDAGMQYLVLPSFMGRPHASVADYQALAAEMNIIGEICKQYGLRFGYHNHDFELRMVDDILLYDVLLQETDPALVFFQPDTYFFAKAGYNVLDFFRKYPGRFLTWHIKDINNDGDSCIIGNGRIDFKTFLQLAERAGLELIIYEQEQCSEGDSLFCAEQSIQYIHSHLL